MSVRQEVTLCLDLKYAQYVLITAKNAQLPQHAIYVNGAINLMEDNVKNFVKMENTLIQEFQVIQVIIARNVL